MSMKSQHHMFLGKYFLTNLVKQVDHGEEAVHGIPGNGELQVSLCRIGMSKQQ